MEEFMEKMMKEKNLNTSWQVDFYKKIEEQKGVMHSMVEMTKECEKSSVEDQLILMSANLKFCSMFNIVLSDHFNELLRSGFFNNKITK